MTATLQGPLAWETLEAIGAVQGPSPYELSIDPLAVDGRRPWPLGIPSGREVLEAIAGREEVARALKPAHGEISRLLPEQLRDSVGTALAGTEEPVAAAVVSCWRAMVAARIAEDAYGVDQPALRELITEASAARERLQALGYFSLDGGASAAPLLHALGESIGQLVNRARFVAKPRIRGTRTSATNLAVVPATNRALKAVFAVVMVVVAAFHLNGALEERRARQAWVVVGDVDRGRAFLAPGGTEPDEANLQALIKQLEEQGIGATQSTSGEWVLHRIARGTP